MPGLFYCVKEMKDYCTLSPDWRHGDCCKQHDIDYKFQIGKLEADLKLFMCVKRKSGLLTGSIFFLFTSTIGWPFYWKAGLEARNYK